MNSPYTALCAMESLPLEELIPHVVNWVVRVDAAGKPYLYIPEADTLGRLEIAFSEHDFNQLDPRLGELMHHLTTSEHETDIEGTLVEMAMQDWRNGYPQLPSSFLVHDFPGKSLDLTVSVLEMFGVVLDKMNNLVVATRFHLHKPLPSGASYASSAELGNIILPAQWVAEHCPDFTQRYATVQAMDLPRTEWPQFIFGATIYASATPPEDMAFLPDDMPEVTP